MTEQMTLDGAAVTVGSVADKVEAILRKRPSARNSYHELMYWYWLEHDGLDDVLPSHRQREIFRIWFAGLATSCKTLQNRAMERQRANPGLDASDDVRQWRDRQACAGPARPASTWPTPPAGDTTASGRSDSRAGTSPRGR